MRRRVLLLGGQTVLLGLAMAFLVVSATSLFLVEYGARMLPYVYICVALAGVLLSSAMARAGRRWSLARLSMTVLGAYAAVVMLGWIGLSAADQQWVLFPLVVLFPLAIPTGFVIVGSQAGRLLDVRQMKSQFPKVVAGFSVGFAAGGLAAAALVDVLGGPEPLLGVEAVLAVAFLALVGVTARTYPAELGTRPQPAAAIPLQDRAPDVRALMRNRMVVVVLGYQVLSAAVTQLLDYLTWERGAARYPDPADLARFLGLFGTIINVVSIGFVFLVAGRLLTRYGLRLGLALNPAGVLVVLAVSAVTGLVVGPASTVFFLLVCAQQVTDIMLTDGTTRTSINATYQALPPGERLAAQTRIEGAGVPLALGAAGVLLLVFDLLDLDVVAVTWFTLGLTAVWLVLAVMAYGQYGVNLRRTLTRRAWDPVALRVDDEASRAVVDRLLASADPRDVRVGLDVLADTGSPALHDRLVRLLADTDPARRLVAVQVVERAEVADLAAAVAALAVDPGAPAPLRGAAARTAGRLGGGTVPGLADLLLSSDPVVRCGAAAGLLAAGQDPGRGEGLAVVTAALEADDPATSEAALVAVCAAPDPDVVPVLVRLAARQLPPLGLADALTAHGHGPAAAALVSAAHHSLRSSGPGSGRLAVRLVRALGEAGTPAARTVLLDAIGHRDRDVADAALGALVAAGHPAGDRAAGVRAAAHAEAERVAHVLDALAALGRISGAEHLRRGLDDELVQARRRFARLLGLLHEPGAVDRAARDLSSPVEAERALALETLEVTLGRAEARVAVAVLDPLAPDDQRRTRLARAVAVPHLDSTARVLDLLDDPSGRWQEPWLRACALHALHELDPRLAAERAQACAADADPVVAQTARWVLTG